jgi:hypothetical protein
MGLELDSKVDSGDNGYNGQLHVLDGAENLAAGSADVPIPVGITGGRVVASYHPTGFVSANAGFLTARINPATHVIELRSSNVADTNLVVFQAFVTP